VPPNGRSAALCTGTIKARQEAHPKAPVHHQAATTCWGSATLGTGEGNQSSKFRCQNKQSLQTKPGRPSVLATLAISYPYESRFNEKKFTLGVNLAWKHVEVTVLAGVFSKENSSIQK